MTLNITISSEVEARLKQAALERDIPAEEFARQLLEKSLGPIVPVIRGPDQATLDLLAQWEPASND